MFLGLSKLSKIGVKGLRSNRHGDRVIQERNLSSLQRLDTFVSTVNDVTSSKFLQNKSKFSRYNDKDTENQQRNETSKKKSKTIASLLAITGTGILYLFAVKIYRLFSDWIWLFI